jgi:HEPN domain-containing protein
LKAALRAAGVEVPHVHDVGAFLREHAERLPSALRPHVDRLASISRRLRREREASFYGDDETGTPPDQLYSGRDAGEALGDARFVVDACDEAVPRP